MTNKAEVVAAMEAVRDKATGAEQQVTTLTEEKTRLVDNNARLLGQKSTATARVSELEARLAELVAAAGKDGADEEAAIASLKDIATELKTTREDLTKVTQERDDAIAGQTKLQAQITYRDAAAKLGVDPIVLEKLLELPPERLVIEGDGVKVKGEGDGAAAIAFDDHVEAQPEAVKRMVNLARSGAGSSGGGGAGNGDRQPGGDSSSASTKGPKAPPSGKLPKEQPVRSVLGSMGFSGPPQAAIAAK